MEESSGQAARSLLDSLVHARTQLNTSEIDAPALIELNTLSEADGGNLRTEA
jgi:hypothetical protein